MEKIFSALRELSASGETAVLVSVIASSGSTPRGSGAKMLVCRDGSIPGTIGGGAVEYRSIALARQLHETKQSALRAFDLSSEDKCDLGMICGGNATVYFQYLAADDPVLSEMLAWEQELRRQETDAWLVTAVTGDGAPRMGIYAEGQLRFMESVDEAAVAAHLGPRSVLVQGEPMLYIEPLIRSGRVYVFGGGHVAQALVPVLAGVGFRCVVFDDRERCTSPAHHRRFCPHRGLPHRFRKRLHRHHDPGPRGGLHRSGTGPGHSGLLHRPHRQPQQNGRHPGKAGRGRLR